MSKFEKLKAWETAHEFVLQIYKVTKFFPSFERYRLVDQICRSSSSVAANIVEGNARSSRREYLQFIYLAKGSLEESKYHLLLAKDLGYLDYELYSQLINQADQVGMLINGLIRYLRSHPDDQRPKIEDQRPKI